MFRMALAFSYQRVSDPKQARAGGAGLDRQADAFLAFCQAHGLTPSASPLVDRGLSAFHGRHRSRGALGVFIAAAEAGQVPDGSVLVVEDLDRFSRETASHAEELLLALFRQQLALGIVRDNVVVDRARYDSDLGLRVMLLTRRDAAHDYSRKLSGRISDVWRRRQQGWEQSRQPYLGRSARPFWLADDGAALVEVPEAVALVQRMFHLSGGGNMGATQIAKLLSTEGVVSARGKPYTPARVLRILRDRRVIGEKTWPDGTTSQGYFPRIITQADWDACQLAIDRRMENRGRQGRGSVIGNLFQGITFCACGGAMYLQQGRRGAGYLRCTRRRNGTCTQPPGDWRYDEHALLVAFMAQRWQQFFDRPGDTRRQRQLKRRITEIEAALAGANDQADAAEANLSQLLLAGGLDTSTAAVLGRAAQAARDSAAAIEADLAATRAELQALAAQPSGAAVQQQIEARVRQFLAADRHDIAHRRRFNNWLTGLGVRLVITDAKLGRMEWDATDAVIYQGAGGEVVVDETLADAALFGLPADVIEARRKRISVEQRAAGVIG